jgi:flagellar biosynthesis GTPase FlhF
MLKLAIYPAWPSLARECGEAIETLPFQAGPRRRITSHLPTPPNFFLSSLSSRKVRDLRHDHLHASILQHTSTFTMTAADIDSKKRKRKHKSKKGEDVEEVEPVKAHTNGAAAVAKPRKKSKKEHTPEPEIEEVVEASEDDAEEDEEVEEDEEKVNAELKQIAADAKAAKAAKKKAAKAEQGEDEADEFDASAGSGANALAVTDLPFGTSIPTVDDPTRFDELNLSDRTMEAIKTMGFETMTEIQRKAIPPLLRYARMLYRGNYRTDTVQRKGRPGSSKDWKWKDACFSPPRHRDAVLYALQAPKRNWCHRRIADARVGPPDFRSGT